jgi:hypothetical protein
MLAMFAKLYAQDAIPERERVRRQLPGPVRALVHVLWVLLCAGGRALLACARLLRPLGRLLRPLGRLLRPLGRLLRPLGRFLRRVALRCLITWRFLPAGFRLTAGAWLVAHDPPPSVPPTAHRRY